MKKINHCAHCIVESDCAACDWTLYDPFDPCCPSMKKGREQEKRFLEEYFRERDYIDKYY